MNSEKNYRYYVWVLRQGDFLTRNYEDYYDTKISLWLFNFISCILRFCHQSAKSVFQLSVLFSCIFSGCEYHSSPQLNLVCVVLLVEIRIYGKCFSLIWFYWLGQYLVVLHRFHGQIISIHDSVFIICWYFWSGTFVHDDLADINCFNHICVI